MKCERACPEVNRNDVRTTNGDDSKGEPEVVSGESRVMNREFIGIVFNSKLALLVIEVNIKVSVKTAFACAYIKWMDQVSLS